MGNSEALHLAHALHALYHQKEKQAKKVEEKKHKLEKIRTKLRVNLDAFLKGKQTKVSSLSREFLRQAVVVDEEKKKLDTLQMQLSKARNSTFASSFNRR